MPQRRPSARPEPLLPLPTTRRPHRARRRRSSSSASSRASCPPTARRRACSTRSGASRACGSRACPRCSSPSRRAASDCGQPLEAGRTVCPTCGESSRRSPVQIKLASLPSTFARSSSCLRMTPSVDRASSRSSALAPRSRSARAQSMRLGDGRRLAEVHRADLLRERRELRGERLGRRPGREARGWPARATAAGSRRRRAGTGGGARRSSRACRCSSGRRAARAWRAPCPAPGWSPAARRAPRGGTPRTPGRRGRPRR